MSLVYPAKLIRDGRVVYDEFPDWTFYMRANRLQNIGFIGNHNTHQSRGKQNHGDNMGQQFTGSNTLNNTEGQVWTINQYPPTHHPPSLNMNPPTVSSRDSLHHMKAPPANAGAHSEANCNLPRMNDYPPQFPENLPPVLCSYTQMSDSQETTNNVTSKTTEAADVTSMKTIPTEHMSVGTGDSDINNILLQPPVITNAFNTPLSETGLLASSCSNTVNSEELYINETLTLMTNAITPLVTESVNVNENSVTMINTSSVIPDVNPQKESNTEL